MRAVFADICGVVTALPKNVQRNIDMPDPVAAAAAATMTGVMERYHMSGSQQAEDLGVAAASRLMTLKGWHPDDIDCLVHVTQTPSSLVPASAYDLHRRLGLSHRCIVVPVNWSCSGYVAGLWLACTLAFVSKPGTNVLLVVGDGSSRIMDPGDRATYPLFGDAVSATAVQTSANFTRQMFALGSDSTGADHLRQHFDDTWLHMNGAEVLKFALRRVPPLIDEVMREPVNGGVDYVLFHQANAFMLDTLMRKTDMLNKYRLGHHQVPRNIGHYGNCSSASIPLLLSSCLPWPWETLRPLNLAVFGFGAGWAWAGGLIKLAPDSPLETIFCEGVQYE